MEAQRDRRSFLGGSDIAAIAGLNPYRTALDVYQEKMGLTSRVAETEPMRWGKLLEAVIARIYAQETHRPRLRKSARLFHPKHSWMAGEPDRLHEPDRLVLEIKTANARQAHRWGPPGTDEVPEEYLAQVAWYLALTDYATADLAVLLGGNDFRIYPIRRDREMEEALIEIGARFWRDHVQKGEPPPIDGSDSARLWLARLFPREIGPVLRSSPAADQWARQLRTATKALDEAEALKSEAANHLKEIIGEAMGIEGEWGKITWKAVKGSARVDWEAIAREVSVPESVIQKHTFIAPGPRRFFPRFISEE